MRSTIVVLIYILIKSWQICAEVDDPRIYNGRKASIKEFPYSVQVVIVQLNGVHHTSCTGSIVKRDVVLTAAHCIERLYDYAKSYYILAGATKTLGEDGSIHNVIHDAIHPDYVHGYPRADLAVVVVDRPFHYDDRRQPIRMAKGPLPTGNKGAASGWGRLQPDGKSAEQLYATELISLSRTDCIKKLEWKEKDVDDDNFCATNQEKKSDTCKGDSGGPFVVDNQLYGVLSQGHPQACYAEGYSTIYVGVWNHISWIKSNARKRKHSG